jgi:hypothetical protein
MANHNEPDLRRLLGQVWVQLMREKRWPLAMLAGLLGSLVSRERGEASEDYGLPWISKAVEEMRGASSPSGTTEAECSFCTRKAPEVRLIAGAAGAICDSCASAINDAFKAGGGR